MILSTISFAIAVNKFQVIPLDSTHVKLGVAIMCLIWLLPLLSFVRPRRGSTIRPVWYFVHWLFGTTAILLGWFNIFKGLDLYVQDWPTSGTLKVSPEFFLLLLLQRHCHRCDTFSFLQTIGYTSKLHRSDKITMMLYVMELQASYVLWSINVAILAFLYLFLDRLPHIRAQSKDPMDPNILKDATPHHKTSAPNTEAGQV